LVKYGKNESQGQTWKEAAGDERLIWRHNVFAGERPGKFQKRAPRLRPLFSGKSIFVGGPWVFAWIFRNPIVEKWKSARLAPLMIQL